MKVLVLKEYLIQCISKKQISTFETSYNITVNMHVWALLLIISKIHVERVLSKVYEVLKWHPSYIWSSTAFYWWVYFIYFILFFKARGRYEIFRESLFRNIFFIMRKTYKLHS